MAQSLFQVVYLSLHGLTVVLSLGYATAYAHSHLNSFHCPDFAQSQEDYSAAEALWVLFAGVLFDVGFLSVELTLPCLSVALTNTRVLPYKRRQL